MNVAYEDRGLLANITVGLFGGALLGVGTGTFAALYLFSPARTAPAFSFKIIADKAKRHAVFLGAVGFAFTAGENLARAVIGCQPGNTTLTCGSMGLGAVSGIALRSPVVGFQIGGLTALFLCGWNTQGFRLHNLPDERLLELNINNPEFRLEKD